ncbi:hypothetical protein TD95_000907 [Thielaviopsis punctulata]|uniref:Polynucleotide 5'-hydroxyl-kinase GRC3 n=1 Tax=Thielaviopsis punctulata TaxID=72032 RepID=A0A0F4ZFH4_9PEZI|nr:hypothetical protein TD95_000907 [Thielaviopsis punctulata]
MAHKRSQTSNTASSSSLIRQSSFKVQMSTFVKSPTNWAAKNGVVTIKLEDNERFTIIGSYGIRVFQGEVTVAGATLCASDMVHWICAPLCHAVPVLRCYRNAHFQLLPDPYFSQLKQLETLSPLYRDIWPSENKNSYQIVFNHDDVPKRASLQALVSPPEWNKKLAEIAASDIGKNPIYFICGPKGAGKSTFTRMLCNKIISTQLKSLQTLERKTTIRGVNIVDIDPGQAEYTPPGLLSLVHLKQLNTAPSFAHPWTDSGMASDLLHSHAFGALSPGADPDLYLNLAFDLCSRARGAPTLINTPGWTLGTGLDLLMGLISKVHPTQVIYMSESGPAETVEGLKAVSKRTFCALPSQPAEPGPRTAAQLRAMQTMSYFHWQPSTSAAPRPSWVPEPLSGMRPLVVSYKGKNRGVMGIMSYGAQMPAGLLAESMNGMIVAVVRVQDPRAFRAFAREETEDNGMDVDESGPGVDEIEYGEVFMSYSPEGLPFIANPDNASLDSQYSCTIGLALVRAIDPSSSTLQLLTPISLAYIRSLSENGQKLILLHGQFDAPTWAYTEHVYRRSLAFLDSSTSVEADDDSGNESEASAISAASDTGDSGRAMERLPWVEILHGNQRRPRGSQAWRVRRDLGRGNGGE